MRQTERLTGLIEKHPRIMIACIYPHERVSVYVIEHGDGMTRFFRVPVNPDTEPAEWSPVDSEDMHEEWTSAPSWVADFGDLSVNSFIREVVEAIRLGGNAKVEPSGEIRPSHEPISGPH